MKTTLEFLFLLKNPSNRHGEKPFSFFFQAFTSADCNYIYIYYSLFCLASERRTHYTFIREAEHDQCLFSLPPDFSYLAVCSKSTVDAMN